MNGLQKIGARLLGLEKLIGQKTPIDPGIIAAATTAQVQPTLSGADPSTWMSPHQPLAPQQQQVAGRQFDFNVGLNLQYTPRGTEPVSFPQLRALADGYDLLRLLVETRKDQLVKFHWTISPIDEGQEEDERCTEIQNFLKFPNRINNWQTWLRALVEDMLVVDAACIYPRMTRGGDLYSLDLMDGTTLKMVIDEGGRRPDPPQVAYQQILKGIPAVDYHADELIYAPRNVRVNRLYGYSPVEQILMTVNIALRRQLSQLQYFTEGNIPEAIISLPDAWSVEQIAGYQAYWDELLEGNTAARRHVKFIAGGSKYYDTKSEVVKDVFDEWLARVCCFAFSIPPSAFIKEMNRATSESAKEAAVEEGLVPLMAWTKDTLDLIIWKYWGYDDLEFQWQDEEPTDPAEIAKVQDLYIRNGTLSIDEVRADLGRDSIGMGNAVFTGQGATLIKDILNPPEPSIALAPGTAPDGDGAVPKAPADPTKEEGATA